MEISLTHDEGGEFVNFVDTCLGTKAWNFFWIHDEEVELGNSVDT